MVSHNGDSGIYLRGYPQVQIWDPDNPREVRNGAEKRVRRALEQQRRQPGQVAAGEGRQAGRRVEHVPDQDDRLTRLDLAERQADGGWSGARQLLRHAPRRSPTAARSSSRRTARRSASATSSSANFPKAGNEPRSRAALLWIVCSGAMLGATGEAQTRRVFVSATDGSGGGQSRISPPSTSSSRRTARSATS